MNRYEEFLAKKQVRHDAVGFEVPDDKINQRLFDWQRQVVKWACYKGQAALFEACGLGKTPQQLEWAHQVHKHTGGDVLILAPLAVAAQTAREGAKFGIPVTVCREQFDVCAGVNVTNYEMLDKFDPEHFAGVVLDESSILKSLSSKTRQRLASAFRNTKYKLACTATPSPNDLMELLNQADFLSIMPTAEALMRWFVHDSSDTSKWRLKGHAEKDFWRWVSSWAVCVNRPSNIGYADNGFILPALNTIQHILDDDFDFDNGQLFPDYSKLSATDLFRQLRKTTEVRTDKAAELVNGSDETWIVWCNTNDESDALKKKIDQSRTLEVKGSDHHLFKEAAIKWFLDIDLSADEIALITRKNSCLGNQNTRQIDEKNMLKIQKKEIVENNNAELLNKTQNTCEIITPKIKTNSTKEHLKSGQNTIKTEETDTVQMKSIESLQKSKPSNGKEKTHPLKNDNELLPTESTNQDTSTCSTVKKDVVQYADAQTLQIQKYSRLLTTATKQERSEDCFACHVTKDLENSKTVLTCYEKPLNTSKGKVLISKASMFGFGINLQHCHNMAFVGLSYSFEQRYQGIRRCWRFGQEHEVNDHVIMHPAEVPVWKSVQQKEAQHVQLEEKMVNNVVGYSDLNRHKLKLIETPKREEYYGKDWRIIVGDSCNEILSIPDESVGFQIFSPPFSNLYVYSDALADMGNCQDYDEFFEHFNFLIPELYRILIPGRLCAVHCIDIPQFKWRTGKISLMDFPGDIIRAFQKHGFYYHSRITVWKDPVTEMQRTKALGLLHAQIKKDASCSRQGIPDYLLVFRKWPENGDTQGPDPVVNPEGFCGYVGDEGPQAGDDGDFSINVWQRYASPVWFDISQTNVLNKMNAREEKDEKHVCPLQLDLIKRAVHLWTNPGDTVFTPFAGIGSELYGSIEMGRKAIGIELKPAYARQAVKLLKELENRPEQLQLFG